MKGHKTTGTTSRIPTSSSRRTVSNSSPGCQPDRRILDCGCGPGMDTERFSQLGYKVTAIDLSDRFVELVRKRVPNARVEKMDMRNLAFPKAAFDGLWASFSLLHIRASEIQETLSGFNSVLRDGGLFFAALHRGPKTKWVKTTISGNGARYLRSRVATNRH